jgi:hypothetical protein
MVSVPVVAMVALMLGLLAVILVRQPRTLTRSLVLTPDEIIMPSPRHRRVPISKVAGVGLVLQQKVPGRGGMWMLTVWAVDDTQAMVGAFLRKSEILKPQNTRTARAAEQVYRHVVERQGADGPLVTIARQRTIQLPVFALPAGLGSLGPPRRPLATVDTGLGVNHAAAGGTGGHFIKQIRRILSAVRRPEIANGQRPTGTRGSCADLAQTSFSSFRSGIGQR